MKTYLLILSMSVLLACCPLQAQTKTVLSSDQQQWLAKGSKHTTNGWIYIHIEGKAKERGFQHGYLLASDIKDALRIMKSVWEYQSGLEWEWLVKRSAAMFNHLIDPENLEEIDGIVEGTNAAGDSTTRDEIVALNGSTELMGYWWPTVKDSISPNAPDPKKESCSSFIATGSMTADGKIVLGHNTWSSYYYPFANFIMDVVPEKGHRILMQTSAGLIHSGTDFFITDAGLVVSETTIGSFFPFDPKGTPEFVRMRRATQDASSIDEWCAMMKKGNNGGYANAWLLGDTKTNEIAWLELGLKHIGFEKKKDGYFTGSNIAEDLKVLRFETKSKEQNIKNPDIARRVRWKQLMKEYAGRISIAGGERMLADHFDTYMSTNEPGARGLCGHLELDPELYGIDEPYYPLGAYDSKVVDAAMAKEMSFMARWGSACGMPFNASKYLAAHPQFDWMTGLLQDRPTQPWTKFTTGK
ncbi:MAG: C45 family autoproteolytic acyltransferase/hydrolase [Ignavibacteriales bacterium]|nr:C45 family autoproteolytic acyltransferase/hydrolase [Ignavibacteriales bacterium]